MSCKDQRHALASGTYVFTALDQVWPPAFPSSRGITVAVELKPELKLFLHTEENKFELWTGTAEVPGNNVWDFLEDLAEACRLPPDPADAVKLLKVRWEVKELERTQFEQLHGDFLDALTAYVAAVQERSAYYLAKHLQGGGVDASRYPIVYDNSWEHFKIDEWDLTVNGQASPMIKWIHEFQRVAEQTFHRKL